MTQFCRSLLSDQGLVAGLYDASVTTFDPYPNRNDFEGPDPTLAGLSRLFGAAINRLLSEQLEVDESIRQYQLLSYDVHGSWSYDSDGIPVSATDDLRYGMSLNPSTKVLITHGYFDLVTPYFTSNRLADLMRLSPQLQQQIQLQHFEGGHMFYTWETSRKGFFQAAATFYQEAL